VLQHKPLSNHVSAATYEAGTVQKLILVIATVISTVIFFSSDCRAQCTTNCVITNPSGSQTITQGIGSSVIVIGPSGGGGGAFSASIINGTTYADSYNTGTGTSSKLNGIARYMASGVGGIPYTSGIGVLAYLSQSYGSQTGKSGQNVNSYEEPLGYPSPACPLGPVDPTGDGDLCSFGWPINTSLFDPRAGSVIWSYNDPVFRFGGVGTNNPMGYVLNENSDGGTAELHISDYQADYGGAQENPYEFLQHIFSNGHNTNSSGLGGWSKTQLTDMWIKQVKFTNGQSFPLKVEENCFGLGDCQTLPTVMTYAGGMSDNSDEGETSGDSGMSESIYVPRGTISSCFPLCPTRAVPGASYYNTITGGSWTALSVLGDGRYLIDVSLASAGNVGTLVPSGTAVGSIGTGTIISDNPGSMGSPRYFTAPPGTFPAGTLLGVLSAAITAPAGSGTPTPNSNFTMTISSGTPTTGWACVTDNYKEEQFYLTVSGSTYTASFYYPHSSGGIVTQGGTCGYYITLNADTMWSPNDAPAWSSTGSYSAGNVVSYGNSAWQAQAGISGSGGQPGYTATGGTPNGNTSCSATNPSVPSCWVQVGRAGYGDQTLRRAIALVGSTCSPSCSADTSHSYYYFGAGAYTSATANSFWQSISIPYSSGSYATTTVTIKLNDATNFNGQLVTITGTAPAGANGTFALTSTANNGYYTYKVPTSLGSSGTLGGTPVVTFGVSTFTMFPGARVLHVFNTNTFEVDGVLTLEANGTPWTNGDLIEEPHANAPYMNDTHTNFNEATVSYPANWGWGRSWDYGNSNWIGLQLNMAAAQNQFLGYGGSSIPPQAFLNFTGLATYGALYAQAPDNTLFYVSGCKASTQPSAADGCIRTDAAYNVLSLAGQSGTGVGRMIWSPLISEFVWNISGISCAMSFGSNVSGTNSGLSISPCGFYAGGLSLNGSTLLNTVSGSGTAVVTNTSPTISTSVDVTSSVPSGPVVILDNTPASGYKVEMFTNNSFEYGTYDLTNLYPVQVCTEFTNGSDTCGGFHDASFGTNPSAVVGAGAGTGGTVAVTSGGNDNSFQLSVATGTTPTTSAAVATVTYAKAWNRYNGSGNVTYTPLCIVGGANGQAAAAAGASPFPSSASSTGFVLESNATALTASTTYLFNVHCQ